MRQKRPSTPLPRSKAKTSPGKPTATKESAFILTPNTLGKMLVGDLVLRKGPHVPGVLHALIHVAGASSADVAKMTGLTRGRIGHYLHIYEPVPADRERQFYETLRGITEEYEEDLAMLDGDPENFLQEKSLVLEAVPADREIVNTCRKVLTNYEAAHPPKVDADDAEVA